MLALILQIFPRITYVGYVDEEWQEISQTIKHFRRIGSFADCVGKINPAISSNS